MDADAEKFKKMSPESSKIIQPMVAQDTAYWDLKEKLQQMQKNYEKLQQNMVEVQMQREAIYGQYQEEMRLRPDTLNKLSSTCEIYTILEDCSERLKDTLSRCQVDQLALYEAYQRSGQIVKELKTGQVEIAEKNQALVVALQDKVKLLTDHQNQLMHHFMTVKQQTDAEVGDLWNKLSSEITHKDELIVAKTELTRSLDLCKNEIEKKEETNKNLNEELEKLIQEFKTQASGGRDVLEKQKKEINEITEENASLKKALNNQEKFSNTVFEQNNAYQAKIAVKEDELLGVGNSINELKLKVQEESYANQRLQSDIKTLTEEKQQQLDDIQNINKMVNSMDLEINELKIEYSKLEREKSDVMDQLKITVEKAKNTGNEVEKVTSAKIILEEKITQLGDSYRTHRETFDERQKELIGMLEAIDKDIGFKDAHIKELTTDLKTNTGKISKLNATLQKINAEGEIEKDSSREREKKLTETMGHMQTMAKNKDIELAKQMEIILEMNSEKERLQEQIESLQSKFDNVQRALANPPPKERTQMQAHLDDDAIPLARSNNKMQSIQPSTRFSPRAAELCPPHLQEGDSYNTLIMFSEGSVEGPPLNMSELNQHFNAVVRSRDRSDHIPSSPFAAFRHHRAASPIFSPRTPDSPQTPRNFPAPAPRTDPTPSESFAALPQVTYKQKNKDRKFFKNKRSANKPK